MPLASGSRLGKYEIVSAIGAGGMGEVYRARDLQLERFVAVKVLPESDASDAERIARFEREARSLAALNHPNIAQIYGLETEGETRALVMELIDGATLDEMLLAGPVAEEETIRIATQIAGALEAAHSAGVIHRDLKPANVKVRTDGVVKVLDLGLAKRLDSDSRQAIVQGGLTMDGFVVGTPGYMSPEQAKGQRLDARSDIFSFGATIYELASSTRAFHGESMAEMLSAVIRDTPAPLKTPLGRVVTRCLAKSPEDRYRSMGEVREALEALVSRRSRDERPSIAVLPFANMSRDADDEYFSDGLSEDIINALTEVAGLKVIARTSAFAFKGRNEDVRQIAGFLGVNNVLEGSVRRSGNRLRIAAQLIRAEDGTHLWTQRFDRDLTDVFAVQDEIAAAIVEALRVRLAPDAAAKRHEPDLRAYNAWLRGLHAYRVHEPAAFGAIEHWFDEAIALDPQWPDPHSLLAEQFLTMAMLGLRPVADAVPRARAEAARAIELRPSDPTAHAVLGAIGAIHDHTWQLAGAEFELAMSAESKPPVVFSVYSLYYLLPLGRFDEALAAQDQAIASDPVNDWWRARRLVILMWAGRYAEAIGESRRAIEEGRGGHLERWAIGFASLLLGDVEEAERSLAEGLALAPWHHGIAGLLAGVASLRGDDDRAERTLASMRGGSRPSGMMMYHLARSEPELALDCYERCLEERQPVATQFASAVCLAPLRELPRWSRVAAMLNLPGRKASDQATMRISSGDHGKRE